MKNILYGTQIKIATTKRIFPPLTVVTDDNVIPNSMKRKSSKEYNEQKNGEPFKSTQN